MHALAQTGGIKWRLKSNPNNTVGAPDGNESIAPNIVRRVLFWVATFK